VCVATISGLSSLLQTEAVVDFNIGVAQSHSNLLPAHPQASTYDPCLTQRDANKESKDSEVDTFSIPMRL